MPLTARKLGLSTLALLAVVAAGGFWLNDSSKWKGRDHMAAVTALWLPSPVAKENRIHVQVWVAGSPVYDNMETTAPYHGAWPIKDGQRVRIVATLLGPKLMSTLGCLATVDGVPDHDPVTLQGPRSGSAVECWAVA